MSTLQDDPTIPDHAELWRRIHPLWVVRDDSRAEYRISSQAFQNHGHDGAMSVQLAEAMAQAGLSTSEAVEGFPGYSLASITAGLARQCDQRVVRDPLPDDPAHALVDGTKTKSVRRRFASEAEWVIEPEI